MKCVDLTLLLTSGESYHVQLLTLYTKAVPSACDFGISWPRYVLQFLGCSLTVCDIVCLVIFVRELFSRFSQIKSHSQKLKPQNFCCPLAKQTNHVSIHPILGTIYLAANRSESVSVPLKL